MTREIPDISEMLNPWPGYGGSGEVVKPIKGAGMDKNARIAELEARVATLERERLAAPHRFLRFDALGTGTSLQFDFQPRAQSLKVTIKFTDQPYITHHVSGVDLQRLKDFLE